MTVGQKIRRARRMADLTQEQLGERIGCAKQRIYSFESGRETPTLETVYRIAVALGIAPSEFDPRLTSQLPIA